MTETLPPAQPNRRRLIKGAAWAAPAAAVSAAAPAYAVSCNPSISISYAWGFNWGEPGDAQKVQYMDFYSFGFKIDNLPAGVMVDRIEWGMWIDIRTKENAATNLVNGKNFTWNNRGVPYPNNKVAGDSRSTVPVVTQPKCNRVNCGWGQFTFSGAVLNSTKEVVGGTSKLFRDGSVRPAWQMKNTWTRTSANNFTATNQKQCGTFTTSKMGGTANADTTNFAIDYKETGFTGTGDKNIQETTHATIHGAIAYLSNGKTISTDNRPGDGPNSWV